MTRFFRLLCFLWIVCNCDDNFANGYNILGIFPIGGRSHWLPYEGMMKALLNAGHRITVITSYPQKKPLANWTDIDISSVGGTAMNSLSMEVVSTILQNPRANFNYITGINQRFCKFAHSLPATKELLRSGKGKFDVVFTEIFGADCDVGFAWKLGVPLISVESSRPQPWTYYRMGNPVFPAYMHTIHVDFPDRMTFWQRLYNTAYHVYYVIGYYRYHNGEETDRISRDFFGPEVPPVNEIIRDTSLIFSNSHHTLDGPVPLVPNMIEVGGIHIKDAQQEPLPADIQKFMDSAKDGVIYFTLGSLVRVSTLPNSTIKAFRDAFAQLPQKVLWKFELEMDDIPPNVMISKWFPQKDIFRHPNLKAYISHGGRMGILEAINYGIPVIGIPLFFDQYRNVALIVERGIAVSLNFNQLTTQAILEAVNTIVKDNQYSIRMKEFAARFKDRPLSAAQSVVYWTEYVIHHKGAHHLKTAAVDMPLYQYLLLDVIGFVLLVAFICLYVVYKILTTVIKLIRGVVCPQRKLKAS